MKNSKTNHRTGTALALLLLATAVAGAPIAAHAKALKTVRLGQKQSAGKAAPAMPGVNVPSIKVDTVGYPVGWRKIAIFNVDPTGAVVKDGAGKTVLEITDSMVQDRAIDRASQDPVWQVDFSDLDQPGLYFLQVGEVSSDVFSVGNDIYDKPILAGLKSFYFQRTRTALEEPYATWDGESYTRQGISHVHADVGWDLEDYPDKKRKWEPEGGWHDAGNFDMYVPSTAPSAQALLMAYEWAPQRFDDEALNIPESGNGIPDILDETKWGLVWVLSMQEEDGSFRHREAVMEWSPEGPADADLTERWIAGVSTSGTAKAVAVLAMASTLYEEWDPEFAQRCKKAASRGWMFLQRTKERLIPDNKGSKQPLWDDEPDGSDVGARFCAAVEVWRRFGDPEALALVEELMKDPGTQPAEFVKGSWANISRWGLASLAMDERTPPELRGEARQRLLAGADSLLPQVHTEDGYRCASLPGDYYWGHNSVLAEKAHILAVAARLDPDNPAYLAAARDQWHWLLGRNPNGYSMTTGVGKGPTRMYHMEWGHHEPPPPGFLLGGPNASEMGFLAPDAPAKAMLWDNPDALRSGVAAHSLWHWQQSDLWDGSFVEEGQWTAGWWAVSEPDILYSADFVLAAVSVL